MVPVIGCHWIDSELRTGDSSAPARPRRVVVAIDKNLFYFYQSVFCISRRAVSREVAAVSTSHPSDSM